MAAEPKLLTASDLDAMTPDERSAAFKERLVTDLDSLPVDFRNRIVATAERLGEERKTARGE